MNAADKARLQELKLTVYGRVAKALLENEQRAYAIHSSSIESNRGRVDKAVRLLKEAGVISKGKDSDLYAIHKFEEAIELAQKPVPGKQYENLASEVINVADDYSNLIKVGYNPIEKFSILEILYIYFHENEFSTITCKHLHETWKQYCLKEHVVFNTKMILKCLVELEMFLNFPQYLQHFVGYNKDAVSAEVKENFVFDKYAISAVFLNNELDSIFKSYENNINKATAIQDSFNKITAWVTNVGGYQEAIKTIRNLIIKDFTEGFKRFKIRLENIKDPHEEADKNYKPMFMYIQNHKSLFNYEALYKDAALKGEEVLNLNISQYLGYYRDSVSTVDLEEFKNEPKDEGDIV
jgi:hypothetical protein